MLGLLRPFHRLLFVFACSRFSGCPPVRLSLGFYCIFVECNCDSSYSLRVKRLRRCSKKKERDGNERTRQQENHPLVFGSNGGCFFLFGRVFHTRIRWLPGFVGFSPTRRGSWFAFMTGRFATTHRLITGQLVVVVVIVCVCVFHAGCRC